MRTTLTIDDDVAMQLDELRKLDRRSLKTVVNDALRRGLQDMSGDRKAARKPVRTKSFDLGEARFPVDNIAEALAFAEGEDFK
ncbi:MAG TPA: hypothetical protein VME40_06980 [Caulobacteraceae bacterium]|nr:hypothetical protein [Caulobacteraceae bacterium]